MKQEQRQTRRHWLQIFALTCLRSCHIPNRFCCEKKPTSRIFIRNLQKKRSQQAQMQQKGKHTTPWQRANRGELLWPLTLPPLLTAGENHLSSITRPLTGRPLQLYCTAEPSYYLQRFFSKTHLCHNKSGIPLRIGNKKLLLNINGGGIQEVHVAVRERGLISITKVVCVDILKPQKGHFSLWNTCPD